MAKLKCRKIKEGFIYFFWCVGCEQTHSCIIRDDGKGWEFSGDFDKPSFHPSLQYGKCHLILTDGVVDFLCDCRHKYAGRKIPLEDF